MKTKFILPVLTLIVTTGLAIADLGYGIDSICSIQCIHIAMILGVINLFFIIKNI